MSPQVRGAMPDTLAYDNGGAPARSTTNFNLLLLGVFQFAHLPGHTTPWLSVKCLKFTYPIHCIYLFSVTLLLNLLII